MIFDNIRRVNFSGNIKIINIRLLNRRDSINIKQTGRMKRQYSKIYNYSWRLLHCSLTNKTRINILENYYRKDFNYYINHFELI